MILGSRFQVGDTVHWDSQAGGHWTRKTGRIIEVVPQGHRPLTPPVRAGKPWGIKTRKEDSFIVEVVTRHSKGHKQEVYWPLTKSLFKDQPEPVVAAPPAPPPKPAPPRYRGTSEKTQDKLLDLLHKAEFMF